MTTAVRSPVTAYAEAVLSGSVVTGRLARLAAERHMRDLETGQERGLWFNDEEAQRAISFFRILKLPDGSGAGGPFVLQPWQEFVVGSLFGWHAGERRRFHYALVELARANGKSPLAAGIGMYGLTLDGEQGAQIYSAATTRDQAKIVFNDAVHMAEKSPSLWPRLTKTVNNLAYIANGSYFRPLAADSSKMDGLRVHIALVDELHEHPNGEVMAKLRTGMKSTQPLLFAITTAGYDRNSVCYEEHDHAVKVLEGVIDNDSYFAFIATLDEEDDWLDEACWPKANPSLGVTVRLETLREEAELAKQIPGQQNSFKRLRLNIWTEQASRWLDMAVWDAGAEPFEKEDLKGRRCFAGLDLAKTRDLSALVLLFPPEKEGEKWKVLPRFWCPEEDIRVRSNRDRVPYDVWVQQGLIETTPGNTTDHRFITAALIEEASKYNIIELAFDRSFFEGRAEDWQDEGMTVIPFGQGFMSMAPPTFELERLLLAGDLQHGGNPVLRWMASNVTVRSDPAGNLKPDKEKSIEKIDGIVALVMALGRAIVHRTTEQWHGIWLGEDEE